ncbi:hypothetical protein KR054_009865 [Drosophila jambulina]|nr:hypothetical protein KR054_009865 [Drosophila jambulina]
MIFVQFWWALLVFNSLGSNSWPMDGAQLNGEQQASEQLQSFSRAVDQAGPELQDLWSFEDLSELDSLIDKPRERRSAPDSMPKPIEGSKAVGNKDTRNWQAEADAWYENLQVKIAKRKAAKKRMSDAQERSLTDSVTDEDMRVLGAQADAWYRDYMAHKAKSVADKKRTDGMELRSLSQDESQSIDHYDQAVKRIEATKANLMKASDEAIAQKQEQSQSLSPAKAEGAPSQYNVKLKQTPQIIRQQENLQAQSWMKVKVAPEKVDEQLEKLQESRNAPAPAAIYGSNLYHRTKPSKLDHEANYKLSKIEQEASEKLPKLPRAASQNKDHLKQKKRRSSGICDPMEEIKLKTSSRLIAKGFGPLLPSESFEITRKGKIEEWHNRMFESTHDKRHQRLKSINQPNDNLEYTQSKSSSVLDEDMPQSSDMQDPQYERLYSIDQQKKPKLFAFDRTKRMPNNLEIKSEPNLRTFSHVALSGQGSSLKQAVEEPTALEGHGQRFDGEEDLQAPQHWGLSDVQKATVTREHESKDMVQMLEQEYHGDSKFQDAALAIKGSVEEKLNANPKMVSPTINLHPDSLSRLHANQETRSRRIPRRTRRVKRSLEEDEEEELLDEDFEDHDGNRVSLGVLSNGLLTPDAEEMLGESFLSFSDHDLLPHNELKHTYRQPPIKDIVSMLNQRPTVYHYHEPMLGHLHKSNIKAYTNFSQMNEVQKYLQVQQYILQDLFEIFCKNSDLLDPTKFKPKTQVAKKLLRQYQDLPQVDQLVATDLLVQDLDELLKMAGNTVNQQRHLLEDVLEEHKKSKPSSSRFIKFLKSAELLKDESEEQTWDILAF